MPATSSTASNVARLRVPGDKSISHRALILAALANGPSRVEGVLDSADVRATAAALRALGVRIDADGGRWTVHRVGLRGLRTPDAPLDCGNSGTTARLLAGVIAGAGVHATLVGDASLTRRPMRRVAEPLRQMGADVRLSPDGTLPMEIRGAPLREIAWRSATASAQVKSAILLAALAAGVRVRVAEPFPSREHTERMLAARGVTIATVPDADGPWISLEPVAALPARDVRVPADPSSAAFPAALAALGGAGATGVRLEEVCVSTSRIGFLSALARMGASVELEPLDGWEEPVANVHVRPGALRGIAIGAAEVPAMVDELPMLACLGALAEGETVITGAAELRVKESDRIAAVVAGLCALGVDAEELPDGLRVAGSRRPLSGTVITHGDHRLAMAFGTLGALVGNAVRVDDPDCVAVSYPTFWTDLARLRA